jgi:hypothetical protein
MFAGYAGDFDHTRAAAAHMGIILREWVEIVMLRMLAVSR